MGLIGGGRDIVGAHVLRVRKDSCGRRRWGCAGEQVLATDVVCLFGPLLDQYQVLTQTVCVDFTFHHTGRHVREGTPSTLLTPYIFILCPFLPNTPAHGAHCMGNAGTIRLIHSGWADALSVSQGSTR